MSKDENSKSDDEAIAENQAQHSKKPNRKNITIAIIILAIAGVAIGTYLTGNTKGSPEEALADPIIEDLMKAGTLPENSLGDVNAPVTIIEYSSMTCPHCAQFHATILPGLKKKYIDTGKVRYIIREFPLDTLATAAFMLARCSGPEKYFPLVDALYAQQSVWAFGKGSPVSKLLKIAKQAGFTKESFDSCLKDKKLVEGIIEVRSRGSEVFGVSTTPSFFINGKPLKGAKTLESFDKQIAPLLEK